MNTVQEIGQIIRKGERRRVDKQEPPGPPPREGLVWKPSTHRWVKPDTDEEHTHAGKPLPKDFRRGFTLGDSYVNELEHDFMESKRQGNNPEPLEEQLTHDMEIAAKFITESETPQKRNYHRGRLDAMRLKYNKLTGRPLHTGRVGYKSST